jgi:alpha-N-arabinofuranosidase
LIPVELNAPEYKTGQAAIPSLNASASRDGEGKLHLSVVNLDPNRPAEITTSVAGSAIRTITGEVLTAPAMNAMNRVGLTAFGRSNVFTGYKVQDSQAILNIPPKSVVVLELR